MSIWPSHALGELFEIARGGSPRPIEDFITDDPNGINWISISDASEQSKYITQTKRRIKPAGASRSRSVEPGDFLLTNSMSFGRPYIMKSSGCIHDGWLLLRPKRTEIFPEFFYYLLGSAQIYSEFARLAAGATVKNLNIDLVRNVIVSMPPLAEQRRIAAILDQADALRAKRRQTLTQLDEMARAIFVDMFCGQAATTWPDRSIDSLSQAIRTGPFGSQLLHSEFVDEGIAVLGIDNAVQNRFAWDERRFITPEKYKALRRFKVFAGDVIITIMGTCGRVAVVPNDIPEAITTKHLCCITLKAHECSPEFLHATLMWHPEVQRQFGVRERGAVMPGLNTGLIKECRLRLAPLDLQRRFVDRWRAIQDMGSLELCSAAELDCLFASLQHRAFRGEL